jgi:hypothetical protein
MNDIIPISSFRDKEQMQATLAVAGRCAVTVWDDFAPTPHPVV